jgi:hypothetical protein
MLERVNGRARSPAADRRPSTVASMLEPEGRAPPGGPACLPDLGYPRPVMSGFFLLAASRRFASTPCHPEWIGGLLTRVRTGRTPALQFHD